MNEPSSVLTILFVNGDTASKRKKRAELVCFRVVLVCACPPNRSVCLHYKPTESQPSQAKQPISEQLPT
ncbi:hypothetical protein BaRGS_00008658 [Batillaria attramentaria]|uniref:Uncharacterized protein n=1 Tax=Batillaria attramentaria TaxID=370345 RepID=A0ABD0LKP3_9CAEN